MTLLSFDGIIGIQNETKERRIKIVLLRSFSFNKLNITEKELSLFKYLIEHPNYKCDVTYEILINALEGRIDYSKEFNLVGYETIIKRNHLMTDYRPTVTIV